MSDEGDRTCPLCAEEMDLTDQQLKPCKCGYDICVWCWHHIMDMAEKDSTEGRCPACRTPYNKEKIVSTASQRERLVTGMSVEKKQKSQKGKTKTSEGRIQLGSVRVIQRNLVYIVGLPLDLADEDLLQQNEYFGQYGKVLKVSISRTAAGSIQQFANSTCSVYITYSKEEEAVRSIQSTHGFVLEGRPLRACFGTTKYCHAWLRNVPCTNVDCLYLHEFGPQEDSFTKDEIVSAYTRNRVQQITGATNDMQRRSGNLLPPPADDYSIHNTSAWAKPISKSTTNNPVSSTKVSPPNSSSGRSAALPAAASWGARALNSLPILSNVVTSNGPSKQQADGSSNALSFSSAVANSSVHGNELVKKHSDDTHILQDKSNLGDPVSMKKAVATGDKRTLSETPVTTGLSSSSTSNSQLPITSSKNKKISRHLLNHARDKDLNVADEVKIHNIASDMSSTSIDKNQRLQSSEAEPLAEEPLNEVEITAKQCDLLSELQNKVAEVAICDPEEDLRSFNDQRLNDTEVDTHTNHMHNISYISPLSNNSMGYSQDAYILANGNLDRPSVDQNLEKTPQHRFNETVVNGYSSTIAGNSSTDIYNGHSYFHGIEGGRSQMGMFEEAVGAKRDHNTAVDLGESSIISNILSMDFDPWDESLTSPRNLAEFLGQSHKQPEPHMVLSSRKSQNSSQSRFSFARQDEYTDQGFNHAPTSTDLGRGLEYRNYNNDVVGNNSSYLDRKRNDGNGFSSFNYEESDNFASHYSSMSDNKISVPRTQVSAPPGFSGPSRAPPPGFTSHERMEQSFDNLSGNRMFDSSSLLRKAHQAPAPVNIGGVGDFDFMDPAILAVGGRVPNGLNNGSSLDMRSNFSSQLNSFENDSTLQLLMQRSFSQHNPRFSEQTTSYQQNNFSSYQQTSFQQPRSSSNVNGHWNSWNGVQNGNDIAMAELLRNERLGFNRYYSGHEDTKFQLPTSGDLYNRTFGI
ncbi:Nucleotide-binding, alpha-beta plait [Artemisia annua]|uniref:Nucleotide-binding, alpha-beta plait n=1 Tax=Artemisia annua TaxID=35608 RepID=A0A2U1MTS4_ARTAN|nr:Nucleotide-binding, alpha-beta plait [Artemisia annua]